MTGKFTALFRCDVCTNIAWVRWGIVEYPAPSDVQPCSVCVESGERGLMWVIGFWLMSENEAQNAVKVVHAWSHIPAENRSQELVNRMKSLNRREWPAIMFELFPVFGPWMLGDPGGPNEGYTAAELKKTLGPLFDSIWNKKSEVVWDESGHFWREEAVRR